MTLRLAMVIDGDAAGAKRAAEEAQRAVQSLGGRTDAYGRQARGATNAGRDLSRANEGVAASFRNTAASVAVMHGPLGGVASRFSAAATLAHRLGIAGGIAAIGIGAGAFAAQRAVRSFAAYEAQQLTTEQVIRATGGAAGRTAEQIERLSREIGMATLASTTETRQAATQLLTFRAVSEETFDRALRASADLAAVGFGSVSSAAVQLGKALEDPETGLTMLRRVGISFTSSQRDMIKELIETGRQGEAMRLILDRIESQVGGAGAAAGGGLAGAWDGFTEVMARHAETVGHGINMWLGLETKIRTVTNLIDPNFWQGMLGIEPGINLDAMREEGLASLRAGLAQLEIAAERRTEVASALDKEFAALQRTELAQLQLDAVRKAGVAEGTEEARVIEELVRRNYEYAQAKEAGTRAAAEGALESKRQAAAIAGVIDELEHELATLGLSNAEQRIANELRAAGIDRAHAQADVIAGLVTRIDEENAATGRLKDRISTARDLTMNFLSDMRSEARRGVDAWEALTSAAMRFGDRMLDMAANSILDQAFGAIFGAIGRPAVATGAPMNLLPAHHSGYGPGDPVRPSRFVSSAEIAAAPRYHSGRLKRNERVAVLEDDESVLTPGQMRAMGGAREVTVKLELVDEGGAPVAARNGGRRREGGVDVQRLIVSAVAEDIASGGPAASMIEGTYGLSRRTR